MNIPRVAFLGVCEHGRYFYSDNSVASYHNLLGLTTFVAAYIYPLSLEALQCVLAVYDIGAGGLGYVILRNVKGEQVFRIDLIVGSSRETAHDPNESQPSTYQHMLSVECMPAWHTLIVPMKDALINEPQVLSVHYVEDTIEYAIGSLVLGVLEIPLPSPERIAALKSDPRSSKSAVVVLGCKYCDSKLSVYAAIEKKEHPPAQATWYQDLEDEFKCSCGSTCFSLKYIKKNMHGLLEAQNLNFGAVSFTSMYEIQALEQIYKELLTLIEKDPPEEEIQLFLNANTVLFHSWSPERIFVKPPILSKYKADYAILDANKTLHF